MIRSNKLRLWPAFLLLCGLLATISSCNDDDLPKSTLNDSGLIINDDPIALAQRVHIADGESILSVNNLDTSEPLSRMKELSQAQPNYTLVLRAEVSPPQVNSEPLRATHIHIDEDLAFVSYNTEGDAFRGGFEVFDISNIKTPKLLLQAVTPMTEYSAISYHDGKIYLAGATNTANSEEITSSAILSVMPYPLQDPGDDGTYNSTMKDISGFTATDVKIVDDKIMVTSGTHGGLTIIDRASLEVISSTGIDDARSVASNNEFYAVMQGTPARVRLYSHNLDAYLKGYYVGGAEISEAKSIMSMSEKSLFIPTGKQGLKIIDIETGNLNATIPTPVVEGLADHLLVTNSVSINEEKIFTANGGGGLTLLEQIPDSELTQEVGVIGNIAFPASANYVASKGNAMFMATGTGGLKIIEIVAYNPEDGDYIPIGEWDGEGRPTYLCEEATPVSQTLKDLIKANFIPTKNLIAYKPQYFSSEHVTDLHFKENTDLKVTFYSETAGWKNTLGYYTYPTGNPPASVADLSDMTILYPNTSQKGSGGTMLQGDKICLRDMQAGTSIGFFMIAQGFQAGKVTTGAYTNYSTQLLNTEWPENHRQPNLLLDAGADDVIILSFEDTRLPGGDKDFDDVIFLLEPTNPASVDFESLHDLE